MTTYCHHQPPRATAYAGLIAQAPGGVEEKLEIICRNNGGRGRPLVGPSGWSFESYLRYLRPQRTRYNYYVDNVYNRRIYKDDLRTLTQKEPASENGFADEYTRHIMSTKVPGGGGYLRPEGWSQLSRIYHNIAEIDPPILIALGSFATWALTGRDLPLATNSGVLTQSHLRDKQGRPRWLIPSYHPSPRNQLNAPLLMFDLMKADNFVKGVVPWAMPARTVCIPQTVQEAECYLYARKDEKRVAVDIETTRGEGFIKSVQFSFSDDEALFVPLYARDAGCSWNTQSHCDLIRVLKWFLESPIPKIFHKGAFDTEWLWRSYQIRVRNFRHDTSLKMHSIFEEIPRDLGRCGASFMNEIAWKALAKQSEEGKEE